MRIKDDEMLRELGIEIRSRRKALRMTQEKLADEVGVTFKHVSDIERGRTSLSAILLVRIATALKVTPNDLLNFGEAAKDSHDPRILSEKLLGLLKGKPKLQVELIRRLVEEVAKLLK
ncbi:hypothetical protein ES703_54071 [subsurface metagenome]|nr:helix-turn-helix domain-containing protein [bacterium]